VDAVAAIAAANNVNLSVSVCFRTAWDLGHDSLEVGD
jgi:hypothetical protein